MYQIKCPKCGEVFTPEKKELDSILSQIRNEDFEKQVEARTQEIRKNIENEASLKEKISATQHEAIIKDMQAKIDQAEAKLSTATIQSKNELEKSLSLKDSQIKELQIKNENLKKDIQNQIDLAKQKEINEKNSALSKLEKEHLEALNEKEKEILALKNEKESLEKSKATDIELAKNKEKQELTEQINTLKSELEKAKGDAELEKNKYKYELQKANDSKNTEILKVKNDYENQLKERSVSEQNQKEKYELELRQKEDQINYFKDLKTRMSTKLVGETLEQHCQIKFNEIRTTAYPRAYFDKDNEVSQESGSKGDFIFRDFTEDGQEYISIMFEMKNETETNTKKHKNDDFLKELDKDRNEKNCEYAVLVSTLEPDNELYNSGIVDVSYKYKKMFVVRPQCFMSIIGLLTNAAKNSIEYKKELALVKAQNLDVNNFEDNLKKFQDGFSKNFQIAAGKFTTAIEEIDKTITHLQKVKENLQSSERNLRLANDKAQDLSIKKLTKNAPSVKEMFDKANQEEKE